MVAKILLLVLGLIAASFGQFNISSTDFNPGNPDLGELVTFEVIINAIQTVNSTLTLNVLGGCSIEQENKASDIAVTNTILAGTDRTSFLLRNNPNDRLQGCNLTLSGTQAPSESVPIPIAQEFILTLSGSLSGGTLATRETSYPAFVCAERFYVQGSVTVAISSGTCAGNFSFFTETDPFTRTLTANKPCAEFRVVAGDHALSSCTVNANVTAAPNMPNYFQFAAASLSFDINRQDITFDRANADGPQGHANPGSPFLVKSQGVYNLDDSSERPSTLTNDFTFTLQDSHEFLYNKSLPTPATGGVLSFSSTVEYFTVVAASADSEASSTSYNVGLEPNGNDVTDAANTINLQVNALPLSFVFPASIVGNLAINRTYSAAWQTNQFRRNNDWNVFFNMGPGCTVEPAELATAAGAVWSVSDSGFAMYVTCTTPGEKRWSTSIPHPEAQLVSSPSSGTVNVADSVRVNIKTPASDNNVFLLSLDSPISHPLEIVPAGCDGWTFDPTSVTFTPDVTRSVQFQAVASRGNAGSCQPTLVLRGPAAPFASIQGAIPTATLSSSAQFGRVFNKLNFDYDSGATLRPDTPIEYSISLDKWPAAWGGSITYYATYPPQYSVNTSVFTFTPGSMSAGITIAMNCLAHTNDPITFYPAGPGAIYFGAFTFTPQLASPNAYTFILNRVGIVPSGSSSVLNFYQPTVYNLTVNWDDELVIPPGVEVTLYSPGNQLVFKPTTLVFDQTLYPSQYVLVTGLAPGNHEIRMSFNDTAYYQAEQVYTVTNNIGRSLDEANALLGSAGMITCNVMLMGALLALAMAF